MILHTRFQQRDINPYHAGHPNYIMTHKRDAIRDAAGSSFALTKSSIAFFYLNKVCSNDLLLSLCDNNETGPVRSPTFLFAISELGGAQAGLRPANESGVTSRFVP